MIIQFFFLLFIAGVLFRVATQYRRRMITTREFCAWVIFWALVAAAVWQPKLTDRLAQAVGVGRGADLLVYVSVVTLFFLMFKTLVRLEKIERDITTVVREVALRDKNPKF